MSDEYKHILTVIGLKDAPSQFASALQREIYGDKAGSIGLAKQLRIEGCRGQAVIRDGKVIEHIHRVGYQGPGYLFADLTHPVVDLSAAYSESTLALKARKRLMDAVQIVRDLKEISEDPLFASSRYRAYSDKARVKQAHESLTAMLTAMMGHAREIAFEGVLVEEPSKKPDARVDDWVPPPRRRTP
jgi:hypothetical protein